MIEHFWSPSDRSFYDTPSDGESLILRPRDPMDNATPSGVSLAVEALLRAAHIFDDTDYREKALDTFERDGDALVRFGPAFGRMLSAADRSIAPPIEVAIVGEPADLDTRTLIQAAHGAAIRNLTVVGAAPGSDVDGIPLLDGRGQIDGKPTAYVCRGYACELPVYSADSMREQMASAEAG
jgi:hypothetical protein